jgi:predicted small secreted protein
MMMKKVLAASLLMAFVLTGCNTFKGVGKDVSKAGDAVTNTAEKTSDEIRRN